MAESVAQTLEALAQTALQRSDPLPTGDLAEHLDSMDRLALLVAIEDHYEIAFEEEDEDQLVTIADVIAAIESKLASKE